MKSNLQRIKKADYKLKKKRSKNIRKKIYKEDKERPLHKRNMKQTRNRSMFYSSDHWKVIRGKCLELFSYKCAKCGVGNDSKGGIEVYHKIPISERPDLNLDYYNMIVLCKSCSIYKNHLDSKKYTEVNSESSSLR